MKLRIAQIDKTLWEGEADSVSVPGSGGRMTVLAHHMPLITTLVAGKIVVHKKGDADATFDVMKGILETNTDEVTILV